MNSLSLRSVLFLLLMPAALAAQQPTPQPTTAAQAPNNDTSYIDAQGTAHVTRVVPLPETISPEAKAVLARATPDQGPPESLADRRTHTDAYARTQLSTTRSLGFQCALSRRRESPRRIATRC
jgi:hypothetical protein